MRLGDLEERLHQRRMKLHIHHTVLLFKPHSSHSDDFFVVFFNIRISLVNILHNSSLSQYVPKFLLPTLISNNSFASQFLALKLKRL